MIKKWPLFPFKTKSIKKNLKVVSNILITWGQEGIQYSGLPERSGEFKSNSNLVQDTELCMMLWQLEEEGYLEIHQGKTNLAWDAFYKLAASAEYSSSLTILKVPPIKPWKIGLSSKGTLTDQDFSININAWIDENGNRPQGSVTINGPIIKTENAISVLPEKIWKVVDAVSNFYNRDLNEWDEESNRRAWSLIRMYAVKAEVNLSDFLKNTVVLTPQKLKIAMRKGATGDNNLIEIQPKFEGSPARWLEFFDKNQTVPMRYQIPDGKGMVHIILTPEVQTVLTEIKQMPGRRVVGNKAQAFLRNPFATLGSDALTVIDPDEFETAKIEAGISFTRFTAEIKYDKNGRLTQCALLVEESIGELLHTELLHFTEVNDLTLFLDKLDACINSSSSICHWQGYDLEILGDTPNQAAKLRKALDKLKNSKASIGNEIFDLTNYSERIEGFGVEKPYYLPFIARKNDDTDWFPENVNFGVFFRAEDGNEIIATVLDQATLPELRKNILQAKERGQATFLLPGCNKVVTVDSALKVIEDLSSVNKELKEGRFKPPKIKKAIKNGLVVKPNVDRLDYEEPSLEIDQDDIPANLPEILLPGIRLKDHQLHGVAWLQKRWAVSPTACRGVLLADDMGLGKTLQLLTFLATVIKNERDIDPVLIVAPVSLLESWKDEISKFFLPNSMRILTLYGATLENYRIPKKEMSPDLLDAGVTKLLRTGWSKGFEIVMTTYETLRDLEFSLAAQHWSIMICDEAQKIKNPNAMVTRAAKKQNARFKVACTGTPVENSLSDLWCLFDFVQPGLLGALKEFGQLYRKPIEAATEDEKSRVKMLRSLIEPQILRRTKNEIAKDLPKKIEVESCRSLKISDRQRLYYSNAISNYRLKTNQTDSTSGQSALGLLQYLRRLCSDPRPFGYVPLDTEVLADIEPHSPKMAWLMQQLQIIKGASEKVIIFCEFRDLQRSLQRCIGERFNILPDVINGDTTAENSNESNRQNRIKRFQNSKGFGVIILSPLAVGYGVNIQAANHVIHFTRSWNPAKEDQATDRAYRIGQTKDVYVYYPVVLANDFITFDVKHDQLMNSKRKLSDDMLNGASAISPEMFLGLEGPDGVPAMVNRALDADDVRRMSPDTFEAFCALLWLKRGFPNTLRTPQSGDGGVDVIALNETNGVLIQCKTSSREGHELGWEAVRDVAAGKPAYEHRYTGIHFELVAVTNQKFNDIARVQSTHLNVELVDIDCLETMLLDNPIKKSELDLYLNSKWE